MFVYFLYNLPPQFRLRVLEIPFMNSQHRGHIELYPLVMGVVVAAYHAVEVLTGAKGLTMSCVVD